jgi:predicted nucleic acid-binding protein
MTWLIDKSALVRLGASPDAADWAARIERGLVRIATVTRLEVGYSARSGPALRAGLTQPPLSLMPAEYLTPAIEDRSVEVLALLADRGQHRAPSVPDHRSDSGAGRADSAAPRQGFRDHRRYHRATARAVAHSLNPGKHLPGSLPCTSSSTAKCRCRTEERPARTPI